MDLLYCQTQEQPVQLLIGLHGKTSSTPLHQFSTYLRPYKQHLCIFVIKSRNICENKLANWYSLWQPFWILDMHCWPWCVVTWPNHNQSDQNNICVYICEYNICVHVWINICGYICGWKCFLLGLCETYQENFHQQ